MIKPRARICTEQQISAMALHNLQRYLKSLNRSRDLLERSICDAAKCSMPGTPSTHYCNMRGPTEKEVAMIKTLDWLTNRVKYEIGAKKTRNS